MAFKIIEDKSLGYIGFLVVTKSCNVIFIDKSLGLSESQLTSLKSKYNSIKTVG